MPELLTTDKPAEDKAFFQTTIPSLLIKQRELDMLSWLPLPTVVSELNECTVDQDITKICTRGDGNRIKRRRGKDKVGRARCWCCKYCTQHGKSFEEATNCPGRSGTAICTGGQDGQSLECIICNSKIKCKCPIERTKG